MIVHGGILTKDKKSRRLVYEKNGKFFIRSGTDKCQVGIPLPTSYKTLFTQYGFRGIEGNPPAFIDANDMWENLDKFHLTSDGKIRYQAR